MADRLFVYDINDDYGIEVSPGDFATGHAPYPRAGAFASISASTSVDAISLTPVTVASSCLPSENSSCSVVVRPHLVTGRFSVDAG